MATFVDQFNSMPENRQDGWRDMSVPPAILVNRTKPSHLPLFCIFAEWGPLSRQMGDGAMRQELYGQDTFSPQSKFFNHQTLYANTVSAYQQAIYQRVVSDDATAAAFRLWIDLLKTKIPEYERGTDGNFLLDGAGQKIPTGELIDGYRVKFVKTAISDITGGAFGQSAQMQGDQTDPDLLTQSVRYPWLDVPAQFVGARGNDKGFRVWAPVAGSSVTPDQDLLQNYKAYGYVFGCVDNNNDVVENIMTVGGFSSVTATFKRDVYSRERRLQMSFEPRFQNSWNDTDRVGMAPKFGPFAEPHLYYENLETVLKLLYAAEVPFIDQFSDFQDEGEAEIHRFNFIGGRSSRNVPYHSYEIVRTASNSQPLSDISTVWAEGGSDGDTSLEAFDKLVQAEIRKYGSIDYEVTENRLGNPESDFYDSGFSVETKEVLFNFIAVRKDTFLNIVTHVAGGKTQNAEEESSLATALYTRGQMFPESTNWGSPAGRFQIVGGDGELIQNEYYKRVPLSLQLAQNAAQYMGAGDGRWREEFAYSNGERANLTMFKNINITWRPITQRRRDWNNGLVYVQSKDIGLYFFPALRTGYPTQNSIFTSLFTVKGFVDLQKIADGIWADFSGNDKLSNEQFKKYIEEECMRRTAGKYDERFLLVFNANFTQVDEFNGFSWTLNVDVGAENMKTVQTTILTGYRKDTLAATINQ
jgi:hypothetical protein